MKNLTLILVLSFLRTEEGASMEHNQIHFRAEFTIEEGKIEEYKKLVQDMSRVVEANEPDTINYEFYINRAETKCMVHETYANSEAVLAHNSRRCIANNTSKDFQCF